MIIRIMLTLVLVFFAECSTSNEDSSIDGKGFDKIALEALMAKNDLTKEEDCVLRFVSKINMDSIAQPLRYLNEIGIRNYNLESEDVRFVIIKDPSGRFYFRLLKDWDNLLFDRKRLYEQLEIEDYTKMQKAELLLKDSIELQEVNFTKISDLLSQMLDHRDTILNIVEAIEFPYLQDKIDSVEFYGYLMENPVKISTKKLLKKYSEKRWVNFYKVWFAYIVVAIDKQSGATNILCLPLNRRQAIFRNDARQLICW